MLWLVFAYIWISRQRRCHLLPSRRCVTASKCMHWRLYRLLYASLSLHAPLLGKKPSRTFDTSDTIIIMAAPTVNACPTYITAATCAALSIPLSALNTRSAAAVMVTLPFAIVRHLHRHTTRRLIVDSILRTLQCSSLAFELNGALVEAFSPS